MLPAPLARSTQAASAGPVTPRFAALIAGGLLLAGAMLSAGVTASLAGSAPELVSGYRPGVYLVCAVSAVSGVCLILARDRVSMAMLYGFPSAAYVLICASAVLSHTSTLFGQTLMLWPVLYAGYLLPEPLAWITLGVGLAAFGVVAAVAHTAHVFGVWLDVAATLLFSMVVVISMRRRIDVLLAQLRREARTDALTGLANLRAFEEFLDRELLVYERHGDPFSLLAIDVDHFKKINDTAGHPAGDAALRRLADLLADAVRRTDMVARVGGEEFGVLLTDCSCAEAIERAEGLRQAVQDAAASWPQPLTVSVGVARVPDHADDGAGLRAAGDAALYQAKSAGRNAVRAADPLPPRL
ncbi:GGDEF domain-containing protein [Actinospica durhamensis]|uniref:GGDEF domain-containing protein n=1 Tax=Actinospica durhamensis TaxID=1508375 RepID=A0A941EM13_9ACTN|nr:GGDEF domain-containing protein [Actinospica durhamensis]MBR7833425.1 GGDEF domain-containing protein [Actinospica durhamensis]